MYEDPLYKMRHAFIGLGAALTLSVILAAVIGAFMGDVLTGTYTGRVSFYGGILLYVLIGTGIVFMKVARHETKPATVTRVLLWTLCLWAWPGLLLLLKGSGAASETKPGETPATPQKAEEKKDS
jgi:hypothetical protein